MGIISKPQKGDVMVLVGTRKGAFVITGDKSRKEWQISEPHSAGDDIFHIAYDARDGGTLYAAVNHPVWGAQIKLSRDFGETWESSERQPQLSGEDGDTLRKIWHIKPGRDHEPGVVYAGVDPAALFKSEDYGKTWHHVVGLSNHPTRERWEGGFGGLCLHSVVSDPNTSDRMWVGISAVGVMRTEDGGETWHPTNKGVRADFLPDRYPEIGQCTHKLLIHDARPETLYQQNHCGVFRSDDGGDEWHDITEGLPSRFGFVLGLHSTDPDTLYVVPEDKVLNDGEVGGNMRYVTDAKFRVYRSRNAGEDWEPLTNGLPQKNAYIHIMREGMATDSFEPCGIYIGTSTGHLYYSRDDGDNWVLMADHLPPINSVDIGVVA